MLSNKFTEKYFNVLDFSFELDTFGFRKYCILPFVTSYVEQYEKIFTHKLFNNYDEEYLKMAKQLMVLYNDLFFAIYDNNLEHDFVKDESEKYKEYMVAKVYGKRIEMYCGKVARNRLIYYIMLERMSDMFGIIEIDCFISSEKIYSIFKDKKLLFKDDSNNPINKQKDVFCYIVNRYSDLYFKNKFLDIEKCKRLIDEINLENNKSNSDIFEL